MEMKNDPVLELAGDYKKVTYFGHELIVPEWVKWFAADASGVSFGYASMPYHRSDGWLSSLGSAEFLCSFKLGSLDWRETLREV